MSKAISTSEVREFFRAKWPATCRTCAAGSMHDDNNRIEIVDAFNFATLACRHCGDVHLISLWVAFPDATRVSVGVPRQRGGG